MTPIHQTGIERLTIDAILNLDKPQGNTSFQMVALIRRLTGERKVGHAGTLDPMATGVLPILIGHATRLATFLTDSTKVYQAQICFGVSTNTYDAAGETTTKSDVSQLSLKQIEALLDKFRGHIQQIPPMYSAIKQQGKPLYQLARAGIEIERKPRKINISRLDVTEWNHPLLTVEIECSKGTYIRSIAHDLGQHLGCGAHLSQLRRTQNGPFHIEKAVDIAQIEAAAKNESWEEVLSPPDSILGHLPKIIVNQIVEEDIKCGRAFPDTQENPKKISKEQHRVYSSSGQFLALVHFDPEKGLWQPERVFTN